MNAPHANGIYFMAKGIPGEDGSGEHRPAAQQRLTQVQYPLLTVIEFHQRAIVLLIDKNAPALTPGLEAKYLPRQRHIVQTAARIAVNMGERVFVQILEGHIIGLKTLQPGLFARGQAGEQALALFAATLAGGNHQ